MLCDVTYIVLQREHTHTHTQVWNEDGRINTFFYPCQYDLNFLERVIFFFFLSARERRKKKYARLLELLA